MFKKRALFDAYILNRTHTLTTYGSEKHIRTSHVPNKVDSNMTELSGNTAMNQEQAQAIQFFEEGRYFLLTGAAGTGKSLCIQLMTAAAHDSGRTVAVTAMTGAAALLIGGKTLHSYLGLGLGEGEAEEIARKIRYNKVLSARWRKLDALIVDEVSMLDPDLFDKIEEVARSLRGCQLPFGGMQVVFSGDFLQLPPVMKDKETRFCFESAKFEEVFTDVVELVHIVRQSDATFQRCLNEIRLGRCSKATEDTLRSRMGLLRPTGGIEPTRLYTRNLDTEKINQQHLAQLSHPLRTFEASDSYSVSRAAERKTTALSQNKLIAKLKGFLDKAAPCAQTLQLCAGAQVMLLTNKDFDAGLVNGSRGVVEGFESDLPLVRFLNGTTASIDYQTWCSEEEGVKVTRKQLPLKLAYAITIHKSQGMSLDLIEVDIGQNIFEAGQVYVALSRVRSLDGLHIIAFDPAKIRAHKKVLSYLEHVGSLIKPDEAES